MIITVAIRKGGSGKTTTAINLAVGLAVKKHRVLLIDTDPQAQVALGLGFETESFKHNLYTLYEDPFEEIENCIYEHKSGLHFLPTIDALSNTIGKMQATNIDSICKILQPVKDKYDYIIIDTPPTESIITLASLYASDYLVIPLQVHLFSIDSLEKLMKTVNRVKEKLNPKLKIAGIILTMVQKNTNLTKLLIEKIKEKYTDILLPYQTDMSVKYIESSTNGTPIILENPNNPYSELVKTIEGLK